MRNSMKTFVKHRKNFPLIIISTFILTFALIFASCEEPTTTPPPTINPSDTATANTIELGVLWSDFNRIALKWTKSERDTEEVPFTYKLKRTDENGNENVREYFLYGKDTTITDGEADTLARGKIYRYKVTAYDKEEKRADTSKTLTTQTLTATSHDFTWRIDTLGMPGDYLYDVWGYDTNNVWAVGAVHLEEGVTAIIKWDGEKWNYFPWPPATMVGIYGFDENSIFSVGGFGSYGYASVWDGEQWHNSDFLHEFPNGDTVWALNAVWGGSETAFGVRIKI